MDRGKLERSWSSPFKGKAIDVVFAGSSARHVPTERATPPETPKLYLKLTSQCLEQADRISPPRKFNEEQCNYLVDKLRLAFTSTSSIIEEIQSEFLSLASPDDKTRLLEIFKLLYSMGKEVEDFTQNCCGESWIQSAIFLTSMSERVAAVGFNLEFCTIVLYERTLGMRGSSGNFDVAGVRQAGAELVKEKANLDERNLVLDLSAITQLNGPSSADYQLASFLLKRLETVRLRTGATLPTSINKYHLQMNLSLKHMGMCLGKGASARVHKAKWLGVEVAKKTFHGPKNGDFLQEVSILEGLSHPHIVSLLWYTTDEKRCHLVMELMDGDLHSLMQERVDENGDQGPPFLIPEALDLMLQVGEGMSFLHEKRIVHRDLKSHNILIKYGKTAQDNRKSLHVKVSDFGMSKTKEQSAYFNMTLNVGTTRWMAPEAIKLANDDDDQARKVELKYTFKSDVYSFAMVCYEILTGDEPFSGLSLISEVKSLVLRGGRPDLPHECPDRLRNLIESCWSAKAITRPSFVDICKELRNLKYGNLLTYWVVGNSPLSRVDISASSEFSGNLSRDFAELQRSAAYAFRLLGKRNDDRRNSIAEQDDISVGGDSKGAPIVPDNFKCPISMNIMRDPVMIATRQTYERSSIQKWLDSGKRTCPKTKLVLPHINLTPNHVLRSSIAKWCTLHSLELLVERVKGSQCSPEDKAAIDELVTKLSSPKADVQRSAAHGIRLRAKMNMDQRICIAEQGAIPVLVVLLLSPDEKTQEHAVSALLNLSINDMNKGRIVAAGAIEPIVEVLRSGCMEARENAAATLYSLSVVNENKVTIGKSGAIPALVQLLHDGTARGKKDAATALFNLSVYRGNRAHAVQAGVVPPLMSLIAEQPATILDEALSVLDILSTHDEGCVVISEVGLPPVWLRIIGSESARNKENAAAILLALCSHDSDYIKQAQESNAVEPLTVLAFSRESTNRAKRKALALLELLKKPEVEAVSQRVETLKM